MTEIVSIAPRIVVAKDIFGATRHYVEIQPRRIDRPTEFFRDRASALQRAEELSKAHGWPVTDETGGQDAA